MGGSTHGARYEEGKAVVDGEGCLEVGRWFATSNGSQDSDSGVGRDAEVLLLVSTIGRDSESGTNKKILIEIVPSPWCTTSPICEANTNTGTVAKGSIMNVSLAITMTASWYCETASLHSSVATNREFLHGLLAPQQPARTRPLVSPNYYHDRFVLLFNIILLLLLLIVVLLIITPILLLPAPDIPPLRSLRLLRPDGRLQVLGHLLGETRRLERRVQPPRAVPADRLLGVGEERPRLRRHKVETPREEGLEARHVAVKVHFGVGVVHRHHLREVDEHGGEGDRGLFAPFGGRALVLAQQDVELVEVAVDQPVAREAEEQADELGVKRGGVGDRGDLPEGRGVDEGHDDGVAGVGDGGGDREGFRVQGGEEGEFLGRGQAREVLPGAGLVLAQVVAVGLDGAERDAAEAVDLEDQLGARGVGDDHDVGFFADADAAADAVDVLLGGVRVEGEVVEAAVGEAVAVVLCVFGAPDQAVLGEGRDGAVDAAGTAFEAGELLDQGGWDELVVLGALLYLGVVGG